MRRFNMAGIVSTRRLFVLGAVAAAVAASTVVVAFANAGGARWLTLSAAPSVIVYGQPTTIRADFGPETTSTGSIVVGSSLETAAAYSLPTSSTSFVVSNTPLPPSGNEVTYTASLRIPAVGGGGEDASCTSNPVRVTVLPQLSIVTTNVPYGSTRTLSVAASGPQSMPKGFDLRRQERFLGADGELDWWSSAAPLSIESTWAVKNVRKNLRQRLVIYSERLQAPVYSDTVTIAVVPNLGTPRMELKTRVFSLSSKKRYVVGSLTGPSGAKIRMRVQKAIGDGSAVATGTAAKTIYVDLATPKGGTAKWRSWIRANSSGAKGWWRITLQYHQSSMFSQNKWWSSEPTYVRFK